VNDSITNLEAIAADHYADREKRANQKLAKAKHNRQKGTAKASDKFLISPPRHLNPDANLWLE
jgi:hypothetical protein